VGQASATDLCATLEASDTSREHPDRTQCVPALLPGQEVTFKLTADTEFRDETSVTVQVTTGEGVTAKVTESSCEEIDAGALDDVLDSLGDIVDW
jgi:hypothetical protein